MSTRPAKPLQPTREERRLELARYFIEEVTPMLAAGEAYADLSVARMIGAVGISRSTFYSYFDDKPDLLRAMGEDITQDLAAAGAHWFGLGVPADRAELRAALRPLFDTYRRHQLILRSITEAASYDDGMRELHAGLVTRAAEGLTAHLAQLESDGRQHPLDPQRASLWLVWMLERGLYQVVAPARDREAGKQLDTVVELVWRMLYGSA
ncbi:MAG TPA: TetR/AcrR family transcriptional regulator [Nocardioides sp.]|nr:TetR/AcrR family transcriptional regulator [Nocardioides sp.]